MAKLDHEKAKRMRPVRRIAEEDARDEHERSLLVAQLSRFELHRGRHLDPRYCRDCGHKFEPGDRFSRVISVYNKPHAYFCENCTVKLRKELE